MAKTKIGIFDSGLGGLTVLRAIRQRLPDYPIVYLGDTARVPYGTKSRDTVVRYALACAKHIASYDVGMLVVACNTVSAYALDALHAEFPINIMGVIEPGAKTALATTRSKRIGVLGTYGTVNSKAYESTVKKMAPQAEVFSMAAPLLVPLVEEGWTDGSVVEHIAEHYLQSLSEHDIDTLILGCTHYPLLRPVIERVAATVLGAHVEIVDSATAVANELAAMLGIDKTTPRVNDVSTLGMAQDTTLLVTDRPDQFASIATRFLGYDAGLLNVELVDL